MKHLGWAKLAIMAILSFAVMYILMYMMVDKYGDIYANLNELYMAAAMTGAMMLIEIAVMAPMYEPVIRIITAGLGAVVLIVFVLFVRNQTGISDKAFLESMIPHHGAALLMCKNAKLKDPEIKKLCESIISSQQSEIDWMKAKLSNY